MDSTERKCPTSSVQSGNSRERMRRTGAKPSPILVHRSCQESHGGGNLKLPQPQRLRGRVQRLGSCRCSPANRFAAAWSGSHRVCRFEPRARERDSRGALGWRRQLCPTEGAVLGATGSLTTAFRPVSCQLLALPSLRARIGISSGFLGRHDLQATPISRSPAPFFQEQGTPRPPHDGKFRQPLLQPRERSPVSGAATGVPHATQELLSATRFRRATLRATPSEGAGSARAGCPLGLWWGPRTVGLGGAMSKGESVRGIWTPLTTGETPTERPLQPSRACWDP